MLLRCLGAFVWCTLLTMAEAQAGAWTLREGQGQVIMTTTRTIAPAGAFFGGAADKDSNGSQIFAEYGVFDDLTAGLTVSGNFSSVEDDVEARIGIHVRKLLWVGEAGDVASVQAGVAVPVERWLGNGLGDERPDSVTEFQVRGLYGRGWQTDWGNSFVSAEAGFLLRGEQQDEELRFDVTVGHEPVKGLLGLFSVFSTVALGPRGEDRFKIAPSIAYTLWPWLGENDKKPYGPFNPDTIQIGVAWDVLNPDDGLAATLSIWRAF